MIRVLVVLPLRLLLIVLVVGALLLLAFRAVNPPGGLYMLSEAQRLGGTDRTWRDIDQMAPALPLSVMAAEDARFCEHWGLDLDAIEQALQEHEKGGRLRGASTLTQQVAKNVFLWHGRSLIRKGLEAGIAVGIEMIWPKRRTLEVYLNVAEFADGIFGAEAAAQHYFGASARDLPPAQAARLAAVLPNPKDRDAAPPSAWLRQRAGQIRDGAETLRRTGRAACVGLGNTS